MLVNSEGVIDGAGSDFISLLGKKVSGVNLKEICENAEIIMNSKAFHEVRSFFIQNI